MSNLAILLEDRGILSIGGNEWRDFLQNLITNDVDLLSADRAIYSALLTPQGKYLYDFLLVQAGDSLLVDVHATQLPEFLKKLMMYRLRADATLEDASSQWAVYALLGDVPGLGNELGACLNIGGGVVYRDPRTVKLGARAILPVDDASEIISSLGFLSAGRPDYEAHRIGLGVVDGVQDLEEERTLLLEANFEVLHGIAFNKGCYVGQEQTARTKHRATIRNRLYPVAFDGAAPESGTTVSANNKDIGTIRSVSGMQGIARLRVETVEDGAPLTAGDTKLTVKELEL